jgi:hypothetical protein
MTDQQSQSVLPPSFSSCVLVPFSHSVSSCVLCGLQSVFVSRQTCSSSPKYAAIVPRRKGTTFINGRMSSLYKKSGRYQFVYNFIHICQHGILLTGHKCVTFKKRFLGIFVHGGRSWTVIFKLSYIGTMVTA